MALLSCSLHTASAHGKPLTMVINDQLLSASCHLLHTALHACLRYKPSCPSELRLQLE